MSTVHAEVSVGERSALAISTVAGTGVAGFAGENEPAVSAQLKRPYGIAVDGAGSLYFADEGNYRIRKITAAGVISTVAGSGVADFWGDNGPAVSAHLKLPRGVTVDRGGALYIADYGDHRIRKVAADGTMSTVAGTGSSGFRGDDGPATAARLHRPFDVAVDRDGALYVADFSNNRIRKITAAGMISTVAGTGVGGFAGDDGPAVSAQLKGPTGVAVDSAGDLYIADTYNYRVRKVAADGTISTVAGTGIKGFDGDDGPAVSAQLYPWGLAVDGTGILYISEYSGHRVRKVAADGTISTVAGTGTEGFDGDDGPAVSAQLNGPRTVAVDSAGDLYITDHNSHRIRKVTSVKAVALPESGTVVVWASVRSGLRMAVPNGSTRDGAEVHQSLAAPRPHQRWRLVVVGQDNGNVLYTIENVRSGKVLEVVGAQEEAGAIVAQRAYEGDDAHHQQWRLIEVVSTPDAPLVYEIANRNSGLCLGVDTNARSVIKQHTADGDDRNRRWQLLPV